MEKRVHIFKYFQDLVAAEAELKQKRNKGEGQQSSN
jgi:hypothetical protein